MNRRAFLGAGLRGALFGAALATGLAKVELPQARFVRGNIDPKSIGQTWGINGNLGGYVYSDELSKQIREALTPALKFRHFKHIKVKAG